MIVMPTQTSSRVISVPRYRRENMYPAPAEALKAIVNACIDDIGVKPCGIRGRTGGRAGGVKGRGTQSEKNTLNGSKGAQDKKVKRDHTRHHVGIMKNKYRTVVNLDLCKTTSKENHVHVLNHKKKRKRSLDTKTYHTPSKIVEIRPQHTTPIRSHESTHR